MNNTATICSIFFKPLEVIRPYSRQPEGGGFNSKWRVEAARRGEYKTLPVSGAFEYQAHGSEQSFTTPVYVDHLAKDLVAEMRDNRRFSDIARIGVWVCEGDTPTQQELDRWQASQDAWCEAWFTEASDMFANGARAGITQLHRDCAIYLGRESAEWVYSVQPSKLISCPMCTTRIDSAAVLCRECGHIIDHDRWFKNEEQQLIARAKLKELAEKYGVQPEPPSRPTPVTARAGSR